MSRSRTATLRPHGLWAVGAVLAATLPLAACASAAPEAGQASASSAPASETADQDSTVVFGGDELPADWPAALPAFPDGELVSAALSEGATQINAVWHSEADVSQSWARMDEALRSAGYSSTGDLDGVDNLIVDEAMMTDLYRGAGYEVSVSVLDGDPVTVLVNASALQE